jgi:arginase
LTAKLIRHPDQLALIGAPTSAAAAAAGIERGPEALRAAIGNRLFEVGYQTTDSGDLPVSLFEPDPESPRARNVRAALGVLESLKLRVEQSAKAHAFPLILGGDSTVILALVAGLRRQAPSLGLVHIGRHADLHTPVFTDDGIVEAMTVSHLIGQGAPELVRFWKEPPLVREPDLVLFGLGEVGTVDRERLASTAVGRFPLEKIRRAGVRAAAETARDRIRAGKRDFVVFLDASVFATTEVPGAPRGASDGLTLAEVREALACLSVLPTFAGLAVSGYDPALDSDHRGAAAIADLIVEALAARHTVLVQPKPEEAEAESEAQAPAGDAEEAKGGEKSDQPAVHPGESKPPAAELAESSAAPTENSSSAPAAVAEPESQAQSAGASAPGSSANGPDAAPSTASEPATS